jgi:ATP-dependent protease ClpP protease subunit
MQHPFFSQQVEQRSFPKGARHNFYIYGPVSSDINEYVDMITIMDIAEEGDEVHLFLNTPGGDLDTTISIIHAMLRTKATVVTHADGQVASAGTILFFAGQSYVVSPYCHFMCHDGSSFTGGKLNENLKSAVASSNLIRKLYFDVYYPFFVEEEIEDILNGGDLYLDSEELLERLEIGAEIIQQAQEEAIEELDEQTEVDFCEGTQVCISNVNLENYGRKGVVTKVVDDSIRKVEFINGGSARIHIRNLVIDD